MEDAEKRVLNAVMQCQRCCHCYGVRSQKSNCMKLKTIVDRSTGAVCKMFDNSEERGPTMSQESFLELIKEQTNNKR